MQVANNSGADQTARMRRLIYTFIARIWLKQGFCFLTMWLINNIDISNVTVINYLKYLHRVIWMLITSSCEEYLN